VDTLGETRGVEWVLCTGDDARVLLTLPMKPSEIGMIMGQDRTLLRCGIRENFRIVNALASPTRWTVRTLCPRRVGPPEAIADWSRRPSHSPTFLPVQKSACNYSCNPVPNRPFGCAIHKVRNPSAAG
jgi:hypothetical protein